MELSNYVIEQMGFCRTTAEDSISAEFHSLHTYEAQGLTLENDAPPVDAHGVVSGVPYQVAFGASVNALARRLLNDDLADDEEGWLVEHKCVAPFLMLHVGPTARYELTGSYVKFEETRITTYEGFPPARSELNDLENSVVPSVLSALACQFSQFHPTVKFKLVTRDVFGITPAGQTLFDFRIEMRGSLTTARGIGAPDVSLYLDRSTALAASISPKVSSFFQLALDEDDPLKRFLYFFLTVERQTHAAFAAIDHQGHLGTLTQGPDRVRVAMVDFFVAQSERWKALQERFVWCALSIWTQLTDADIASFKELKRVRDQLAHGEISAPSAQNVLAIEGLAKKLQLGPNADA
jgi:hypothetical protein